MVGLLFLLLLSGRVWAVDAVSVEVGKGFYTDVVRVGAIWDSELHWSAGSATQLVAYWEATAAAWRGYSQASENQVITDLGLTPVFRLQQQELSVFAPYLEGGIGFHLISPTFIYSNRKFGSAFPFGDLVGIGMRFGEHHQFDLGYRFLHVSNGDIKQPNPGINFKPGSLYLSFLIGCDLCLQLLS